MKGNLMHQPSRIILANESRLLREMLKRAIAKSPHLRVVGEVTDGRHLPSMVGKPDAQWVIVSLQPDGDIPDVAETLLIENPSVTVLAVASDGSQIRMGWAQLYERAIAVASDGSPVKVNWTETHDRLLEDLSLAELITVLCKGSLWKQIVRDSKDDTFPNGRSGSLG
jgi:hypothetical protein